MGVLLLPLILYKSAECNAITDQNWRLYLGLFASFSCRLTDA